MVIGSHKRIDFTSNDYLDLSRHSLLIDAAKQASDAFGVGSGGSRLLGGDFELTHQLEEKLAQFWGTESALFFNSGYHANVGVLSACFGPSDLIILDKYAHASLIDGARLSGAKLLRFLHHDMAHLEKLLTENRSRYVQCVIVTESLFSMDGDVPDFQALVALKHRFNAQLYVDEAHAVGALGKNGNGLAQAISNDIDFRVGTFGKALGSMGAWVGCSVIVRDHLINQCRSFIFSTALPPAVVAANLASIDHVPSCDSERTQLADNATHFRHLLSQAGIPFLGASHIVSVMIGNSDNALRAAKNLQESGYQVMAIRPPSVPPNTARLRFSLRASHSKDVLTKLVVVLQHVLSLD